MDFIELLQIPEKAIHKERIPLKEIVNEGELNSNQKKLSIHLLAVLETKTINITSYTTDDYLYKAIYVFEVSLKKDNNISELNEIIQSVIPNPSIFCYQINNDSYISLSPKRRNKVDKEKSVIEEIVLSNSLNEITEYKDIFNINTISATNLKVFYEDLSYKVYASKLIKLLGFYPKNNTINLKEYSNKISAFNRKIAELNTDYKNASMLAEKMKISLQIKEIEIEIEKIKEILKEEN